MTDEKHKLEERVADPDPENEAVERTDDAEVKNGAEEQAAEGDAAPEVPPGDTAERPPEEKPCCAAEKARAEEYHQRMLRLQADFENFRRRTRQEKEEWFRLAAEEFAQALLPILDNFDLAMASPGADLEQFLTGMRMIRRQLMETLNAQGLEPLTSVGQVFDPARHEAVGQVTGTEHPDDTVVEELRRGYLFRGRILRPAMVRVAKSKSESDSESGGNTE
ncbi:MAG: nucleotide exchange factor GrpE [Bacillota bacterium]|nr:nucleotide exchange factor GrpE [Bacillota bacterium]